MLVFLDSLSQLHLVGVPIRHQHTSLLLTKLYMGSIRRHAYKRDNRSCSTVHFLNTWHQCLPHILFMTPRTDVCHYCEGYRIEIQHAFTESKKENLLHRFKTHLEDAQKERDAYLAAIEQSKHANSTSEQPDYVHYTFDFAQQVFLPYHSRQVGPLYYKVPLRVQIFGISNDGISLQTYLG